MKNIKSIKKIINQLLSILTRKQKKDSLIVFFSMLSCSCLELLGVSAIYPFLQVMLDESSMKNNSVMLLVYKTWPNIAQSTGILILGIFIMVIYLVKNAAAILCNYIQISFANRFQKEASTLMLESYLSRPYEFFVNNNSSMLIRGIENDINGVYYILVAFFELIAHIITVLLIGIYLFWTDWVIAVGALGIAAICFLGITLGFKKPIKEAGVHFREAVGKKYQYAYQAISGIKEISVLNRRELFVDAYRDAASEYEKANRRNSFLGVCPDRILEGVCIAGFMGVICIRITIDCNISTFVPTMGAFAMGAFKILPSISKVSSRLNSIVFYQLSLQNCYENIIEAHGVENLLEKEDNFNYQITAGESVFKNKIVLNNISWKYQNSTDYVLKSLDLEIGKGDSIALIGSSGAGKTTLVDVILGLLPFQEGEISIDGIGVSSISNFGSHLIGYVPQNVFLIDDSIRANIAFGLPKESIDDEKVWNALKKSQLNEFVSNLPSGLDTIVGERGVKFSGGQRQRIAIARALYEDPEILVLDEATSALDTETENAVMEAIESLQGIKTLIIVAHRLSTIRNCDKIYEISNGHALLKNQQIT